MPQRIPAVPGSGHDGGILLSERDWDELTAPLGMAGSTLDQVLGRAALMVHRAVDGPWQGDVGTERTVLWPESQWMDLIRPLMDADGLGTSFPPDMTDVAARVRRLIEAKQAAEHQARTLAGEVADLTDRLEDRLPAVFDDLLTEIAADVEQRMADLSEHDIVDAGNLALTLALRLVTDYDVRARNDDQARPADPVFKATQDILDTVVERVRGTGPVRATDPGSLPETSGYTTHAVYGVPISVAHPAVVYLAEHLGQLKGCDGSLHCRRATVALALLDAAEDVTATESLSGNPLDTFTRRCAERLADLTVTRYGLQALADLCRDAWEHAARIILRNTTDALTCEYPDCTQPGDPRTHLHLPLVHG